MQNSNFGTRCEIALMRMTRNTFDGKSVSPQFYVTIWRHQATMSLLSSIGARVIPDDQINIMVIDGQPLSLLCHCHNIYSVSDR